MKPVDIFQHTSAIIAALMIFFDPQLIFMDLVFTYVLGVFILAASIRSLSENVLILMEAAPGTSTSISSGTTSGRSPRSVTCTTCTFGRWGPGRWR